MAYIIDSLKKINIKDKRRSLKKVSFNNDNKILFFIIILSAIVIAIDYALIIKFIDLIKNI